MYTNPIFASSALLVANAAAQIANPANIQNFYNAAKAQGDCMNKLASGLYSYLGGPANWSYCGDHLNDYGIIYVQGKNGLFANMDIDCDGIQKNPNDGRCGTNPSDQGVTAMRDTLRSYDIAGETDLDPYRHPFIVFGNSGSNPHNVNFRPKDYGVQDLSITLVVTPTQTLCAIWGDTNGGERDASFVGEAALATGELLFGNAVSGTASHDPNDVLYIAFTGADAVPGASGAAWNCTSKGQFEASIMRQCMKLISRIGSSTATTLATSTTKAGSTTTTSKAASTTTSKAGTTTTTTTKTGVAKVTTTTTTKAMATTQSCTWAGHCLGASCSTNNDCSDQLVCRSKKCSN